MELLRALTVDAFAITIFLAVLVEGMVVSRADVGYVFSKPGRLVRTILAMNILGPIVAIIVCRVFDLDPAALLTRELLAPIGVLLAVVVNEVAVVPYRSWRQRVRRRNSAVSAPAGVNRGVGRR